MVIQIKNPTLNTIKVIDRPFAIRHEGNVYTEFSLTTHAGHANITSFTQWQEFIKDSVRFCAEPVQIRYMKQDSPLECIWGQYVDLSTLGVSFLFGGDKPVSEFEIVTSEPYV